MEQEATAWMPALRWHSSITRAFSLHKMCTDLQPARNRPAWNKVPMPAQTKTKAGGRTTPRSLHGTTTGRQNREARTLLRAMAVVVSVSSTSTISSVPSLVVRGDRCPGAAEGAVVVEGSR